MVGRKHSFGQQYLNLAPDCFFPSTIMHELFHTLGVDHTQSRSDRDKHVIIHWENIIPEVQYNFCKDNSGQTSTYGVKYDAKSIMHYRAYNTFAIDIKKPSMSPKMIRNVKSYVPSTFYSEI